MTVRPLSLSLNRGLAPDIICHSKNFPRWSYMNKKLNFLLALFLTFASGASAAPGVAVDPGTVLTINKARCANINGVWTAGTLRKNGIFIPTSSEVASTALQLKKKGLSSEKKNRLKAKLKKLRRALKANSKICAGIGASPKPSATPSPVATPAVPLPNAVTVAWNQNATSIAANFGGEYLYFCPANPSGSFGSIYGHDIYTTDSPLCVAAVHLGLFQRGVGGNVKIKILGAQGRYTGSYRNNVQSFFYGSYPTSYVFLDIDSGAQLITNTVPEIRHTQDAGPLYTYLDQTFTFYCGNGVGQTDSIWGTDLYTYDSSICTAAVHAGRIALATGGAVTIQIKPGAASYMGSTRNGIASQSYGVWGGSFIFVP